MSLITLFATWAGVGFVLAAVLRLLFWLAGLGREEGDDWGA